jgi:type IV pilus assembly protein PilM
MATNHDDAAPPADPGTQPPAETEAKATPERAAAKPVKAGAGKPAANPNAKPAAAAGKAAKPVVKAAAEKRTRPAPPKEEEPAEEREEETAPAGESDEAPADGDQEETPDGETAVQTESAAKGKKKKAKAETGVTTKPGLASFFNFHKAAPAGVWGVDLGQCALKAIRLEIIDGEVAATAFDYVEHPKILSQPDADPDELTREALQKFLSRNTLRGDTVAISVPGQSGLARFVKLPPVEEKKIPDIVRFEAKQQIPFNLDEVVWDYQKLGVGELAAGFVETEIGLFAMKRDMVNRYLQHFKDVGVEVHLVQMAPLSLCNFVAYDLLGRDSPAAADGDEARAKKQCITALDIGADSSNLVITDGGRIIWQRPIPLGGNHFTRALTKDLKLTFAKAEHLKRNAVKSPDLKKILASLKPVLGDFVGEVQRSLGYFTNTHRDAQIAYMIGLGNAFRLPGLQRYLAEKLQMEVRKIHKMERLTGDGVTASATYVENILSFGVAYGLALQGLKRTKLQTNLLPGEIRTERAVRGKKPWAIAAAALLLFGLGGFTLAGACNLYPYTADSVTTKEKEATDVAGLAKTAQGKFDDAKNAALEQEKAVKSIVAGQAERKNWLVMTRYLFGETIPNPDGSNLSDDAKKLYWTEGGGEKAFKALQNRWKGLPSPGASAGDKSADAAADLGADLDNLIQVDIEFFDQRYCDDLATAWGQIKEKSPIISGSADRLHRFGKSADYADLDKGPNGRGWLVEVHGSTYHQDPNGFLADTLVDNIYRLSVRPDDAAAPSTPPAPPAATPPMGAADKTPAAAPVEIRTEKDAYLNQVSHVVLFDAEESGGAGIVGRSVLDELLPGGTGSTGGLSANGPPMPSATGAPPGANGGVMVNPNAAGGQAANATANSPTTTAVPRDWKPLSAFMQSGSSSSQGNQFNGADSSKTGKSQAASKHPRTEFVIVFIWKEPAPSDILRGYDPDAKPPPPAEPSPAPTAPQQAAPTTTQPAEEEKPITAGGLKDI